MSALIRASAYIFLRRRFSSSNSLSRPIIEASMPPELGPPLVEAGRADAVGPTQFRNGGAALGLLEHGDDLAVGKAGLFMKSPRERLRENSTSEQSQFTGGLPISAAELVATSEFLPPRRMTRHGLGGHHQVFNHVARRPCSSGIFTFQPKACSASETSRTFRGTSTRRASRCKTSALRPTQTSIKASTSASE